MQVNLRQEVKKETRTIVVDVPEEVFDITGLSRLQAEVLLGILTACNGTLTVKICNALAGALSTNLNRMPPVSEAIYNGLPLINLWTVQRTFPQLFKQNSSVKNESEETR